MPVSYPSTLPTAGLTGGGGGVKTSTLSDERSEGEQEHRQRQGIQNQVINVEYPPLSQTEYEAFKTFFEETLFSGILPFEFNDPATKDTHVYKFVKNDPAYNETRVNKNFVSISFQLIRLKFIAGE